MKPSWLLFTLLVQTIEIGHDIVEVLVLLILVNILVRLLAVMVLLDLLLRVFRHFLMEKFIFFSIIIIHIELLA